MAQNESTTKETRLYNVKIGKQFLHNGKQFILLPVLLRPDILHPTITVNSLQVSEGVGSQDTEWIPIETTVRVVE